MSLKLKKCIFAIIHYVLKFILLLDKAHSLVIAKLNVAYLKLIV